MRTIKVLFGLLAIGLWFFAAHQWNYYIGHRPATPQTALGFTHPLENHGSTVYLTSADCWILYGAMIGAVISFIAGTLCAFGEKLHGGDVLRSRGSHK